MLYTPEFLSPSTINILNGIILCCKELSCALLIVLQGIQQHVRLLPTRSPQFPPCCYPPDSQKIWRHCQRSPGGQNHLRQSSYLGLTSPTPTENLPSYEHIFTYPPHHTHTTPTHTHTHLSSCYLYLKHSTFPLSTDKLYSFLKAVSKCYLSDIFLTIHASMISLPFPGCQRHCTQFYYQY